MVLKLTLKILYKVTYIKIGNYHTLFIVLQNRHTKAM